MSEIDNNPSVEELKEQIDDLQRELEQQQNENERLWEGVQFKTKELLLSQKQNEELKKQQTKHDQQIQALEQQIQRQSTGEFNEIDQRQLIEQLTQENNILKAQLTKADQQFQEETETSQKYFLLLQQTNTELAQFKNLAEKHVRDPQFEKVKSVNQQMTDEIRYLQIALDRQKEDNKDIKDELEITRANLLQQQKEVERHWEALQDSSKQLTNQAQALNLAISIKADRNISQQSSIQNMKAATQAIATYEEQLENEKETNNKLHLEIKQYQNRELKQIEQFEQLEQQLLQEQTEKKALWDALQEQNGLVNLKISNVELVEAEANRRQNKKRREINESLELIEAEKRAFRKIIDDKDQVISEKNEQITDQQEKIIELETQIEDNNREIERQWYGLQFSSKAIEYKQKEAEDAKKESERLRNHKNEIEKLEQIIKLKDEDLVKTTAQLTDIQKKFQQRNEELGEILGEMNQDSVSFDEMVARKENERKALWEALQYASRKQNEAEEALRKIQIEIKNARQEAENKYSNKDNTIINGKDIEISELREQIRLITKELTKKGREITELQEELDGKDLEIANHWRAIKHSQVEIARYCGVRANFDFNKCLCNNCA
ncbi:Hypothetical_protein [Hexamita inflata]|uniref:Hypothetical_protein n=1 Tax=Hexamita inflata TaxID=28002 RepID=A0AA86NSH7_9EUKA|nr:Hypothetical protein HINF_LOCUS11994 [Hexamita inflata]